MPPDTLRAAYAKRWFFKAQKDLRVAELLLAATPPDPENALFHCQQAVEKALKGFLAWHEQPFRKVHNLGELGNQCIQIDPALL